MKITILTDNYAGKSCTAEWGLSCFIEDGIKILFDFGASDMFLKNAEKLKVNPLEAQYYVLSHGHWDHGNGAEYLPNDKLNFVCHPDAFIKRYRDDKNVGLPFDLSQAQEKFNLILTSQPYQLAENIYFLGEIPRLNDFEAKKTIYYKEDGSKDYIMDDSALVIKSDKGLIIISGCAHSGICNTIEHAIKVTGVDNIYTVFGGFHLQENNELTQKTISYLKKIRVRKVIPTHCTQFPALVEFHKHFASNQVHTGQILEF